MQCEIDIRLSWLLEWVIIIRADIRVIGRSDCCRNRSQIIEIARTQRETLVDEVYR